MMGLFMTAMAVVMLLSGAGIDRINERKAKNQQTQPAQITYVSESAGTSNEPEQVTKQNNEPVLAAEGKNDVTAPAAGINNELAQADEKNEPDVHESMPVYAPVVDEPTPEAMPEVDVAEHNDESAHVTEEKSSPAAPETEQDKLSEATEFWRKWVQEGRDTFAEIFLTGDSGSNCFHGCDLAAVLSGHDESIKLCGPRDEPAPFGYYTFEKCADPSAAAEVARAAMESINTELDSLVPILAEKVEVNDGKFDTVRLKDVLRAELKRRAHNHGWDLPFMDAAVDESGYGLYFTLWELSGNYNHVRDYLTAAASDAPCNWISDLVRSRVTPFCDANKNFPDCEQYLEKLAECAANKDEL